MASAIRTSGDTEAVLSPLEPKIAASLRAWERFAGEVQRQYPDHFCCTPRVQQRAVDGWLVTESRCVWTDMIPTILPLCDVVELFSLKGGQRAYLELERALPELPFLNVIEVDDGRTQAGFLRLSGLSTEEMRTLFGLVTSAPTLFRPG